MADRLALAFALALVTTQPVLAQSPEANSDLHAVF